MEWFEELDKWAADYLPEEAVAWLAALPQQADECVTEQMLLTALGLEIGDTLTVTLDEADQDSLTRTSYTIVGTVQSPLYVGTDRGSTTLGSGSIDAFVYIPGENFDLDVYTTAYFTGDGMEALNSYSQAYADQLSALVDSLDPLAQERASLRDEEVRSEAQKELDDARSELADAQKELDDAKKKLDDARAELDSGWADYESGLATLEQEIKDGQAKLNAARSQLEESQTRYEQGKVDYQEGLAQYQEGQTAYEENLAQLDAQQEEVAKGYEEYYDADGLFVAFHYDDNDRVDEIEICPESNGTSRMKRHSTE